MDINVFKLPSAVLIEFCLFCHVGRISIIKSNDASMDFKVPACMAQVNSKYTGRYVVQTFLNLTIPLDCFSEILKTARIDSFMDL